MVSAAVLAELRARVEVLAAECPGLTFGYIGNCGVDRSGLFDDRTWSVFLPHWGRVGTFTDRVGSYSTERLPDMLAAWAPERKRLIRSRSRGARTR